MSIRQIVSKSRALLQTCRAVCVSVPWGHVRGIELGPPDDPSPVLLLHGFLDNCHSFLPLLSELPAGKRYIALDLPGHGLSSHKPLFGYSTTFHKAADIEIIRRSLGIDHISLVGHSMGALMSVLYSAAFPEFVRSVVTIDVLFPHVEEPDKIITTFRKAVDDFVDDSYERKVFKDKSTLTGIVSKSLWYGGLDHMLCELIVDRNTKSASDDELEEGVELLYDRHLKHSNLFFMSRAHAVEVLKSLKAPVLHVAGERGLYALYPGLKEINHSVVKTIVADLTIKEFDAPHHLHMSHPQETAQYIQEFYSRLVS